MAEKKRTPVPEDGGVKNRPAAGKTEKKRPVPEGTHRKKKKKRAGRRKRLLTDLFLVVLLVFSLTMLILAVSRYVKSRKTYASLRESVTVSVTASPVPLPTEAPVTAPEPEAEPVAEGPTPAPERVLSTEPGVRVDWEPLLRQNDDVAAWLYCPDTIISYPVMFTGENEFYLDHDFYGNPDECGALFFDCRSDLESGSPSNWIVYGHRRNDRSMFGTLSRFGNQEYLDRHPVMYLLTPEHTYRVELFACRTVRAEQKYFAARFSSAKDHNDYINKALSQSYWQTDVKVGENDTILTMVTCNKYDVTDDPRLLLHGRLVPLD